MDIPVRPEEPKNPKSTRTTIVLAIVVIVGLVMMFLNVFRTKATEVENHAPNPSLGAENAAVVIREYSDFQCPACRVAVPEIESALQKYSDVARLEFNYFPLRQIHPNSQAAALAAAAAAEQGKFWAFHNLLFEKQEEWSGELDPVPLFVEYFKTLEGDPDAFKQAIDDRKYAAAIQDDVDEAAKLDITSTPTFFVNDERVVGARSAADWEVLIQKHLTDKIGPFAR
ncbi:MAG: thioredoxin domain-containing protein [bacterium]